MMKFDNHDNRPVNNSLTTAERARLVELHFERCAERQFLSDVNLARTLHLGAVLNELEIAPC
jgi:hypothetical protein